MGAGACPARIRVVRAAAFSRVEADVTGNGDIPESQHLVIRVMYTYLLAKHLVTQLPAVWTSGDVDFPRWRGVQRATLSDIPPAHDPSALIKRCEEYLGVMPLDYGTTATTFVGASTVKRPKARCATTVRRLTNALRLLATG